MELEVYHILRFAAQKGGYIGARNVEQTLAGFPTSPGLVRGDDAKPAWGFPDVLTPSFSEPWTNGMRKVTGGDAYICFVRYQKDGNLPLIESVNTFGASMDPASPHFKDQMGMFQAQQTKRMTLDKGEVMRKAERVYHPK